MPKMTAVPDARMKKMPEEPGYFVVRQPQCVLTDDVYMTGRHLHKEVEMVFVLSGQAQMQVESRLFTLIAGELLCIRGSVPHELLSNRQQADLVQITFLKEWLLPAFFASAQREACLKLYSQVFKTKPCDTVRDLILSTLHCPLPGYKEYYRYGKLVELTARLLALPETIGESQRATKENLRYMESAIEYMQNNCHDKLTLKMLSDHLGLTESYCSRYIRQNAGITFVEYLNAMRVSNAQQLLCYTGCSMAEIVRKTGFSSVQTFNRVFRQQTGKSPSEYRKCVKQRHCTDKG